MHYVIWTPSANDSVATRAPETTVIMLVHGAEHTSWCWEPVATLLVERFGLTAVSMDLRGHGESMGSQSAKDATLEGFAEDVARVADQVCLELAAGAAANREMALAAGITAAGARRYARAAGGLYDMFLVGHSMGGFIADYFARRYPLAGVYILDSVTPMQVMASVWGWILRSVFDPLHPRRRSTCIRAMSVGGRLFDRRSLVRAWLLGRQASREQVDQLFAHLLKGRESSSALKEAQAIGRVDRRALRKNPHHLRDIWQTSRRRYASGGRDMLIAPRASAESARLTGATYAELPGLPHDAMLATNQPGEQVGEAVAVDIAQFVLRTTPAPSGGDIRGVAGGLVVQTP